MIDSTYKQRFGCPDASQPSKKSIEDDLRVKKQSIESKKELSMVFHQNSDTSESKHHQSRQSHLSATLNMIMYGTGAGKSYGSINTGFLQLYDDKLEESATGLLSPLHAQGSGFTNCVYITPTKNQFKTDKHLREQMLKRGITPISWLSREDLFDADFKLWADGRVTNLERLHDYLAVIKHAQACKDKVGGYKNAERQHLKVINSVVWLIISNLKKLRELKRIERVRGTFPKDSEESLQKIKVENELANHMKGLVTVCLNRSTKYDPAKEYAAAQDSDDSEQANRSFDDSQEYLYDDKEPEDGFDKGPQPIEEDELFSEIFSGSLEKEHYDDLVSLVTKQSNDSEAVIRTLKRDILRIYAPWNYASCVPCFITMTSLKSLYASNFFRHSLGKGSRWLSSNDFATFADLVGNKDSNNLPLPPCSNIEDRVDLLKNALLRPPKPYKESPFYKKDINFHIIIDEADALFDLALRGSDTLPGVIKRLNPSFSITDLLAVVSRKLAELNKGDEMTVNCHALLKTFFITMARYLKNHTNIDINELATGKLLDFSSSSTPLYANNSEAEFITNVARNAFSMGAKNFLSKKELQAIYVCKRGDHRYLSLAPDSESEKLMTLFDMYQIAIAIFYAAFDFAANTSFQRREKDALILDLNSKHKDPHKNTSSDDRQNRALANLLNYALNNSLDIGAWLRSIDIDVDDIVVDDWFAYAQAKMLFTMSLDKTFDNSPDKSHQSKTFLSIDLYLVKHAPEMSLLKMLYNTNNTVSLMSATSGRYYAYSSQFNMGFLEKWCRLLDIRFKTPKYDTFFDLDYRDSFLEKSIIAKRGDRKVTVIPYKKPSDIEKLGNKGFDSNQDSTTLASRIGRQGGVLSRSANNKRPTISALRSTLMAVNTVRRRNTGMTDTDESQKAYEEVYLAPGSFNDKALDRAIAGLLLAMRSEDTTLIVSQTADLVRLIYRSIHCQFTHGDRQVVDDNKNRLAKALKDGNRSVAFIHPAFGRFKLPMLDDELARISDSKHDKRTVRKQSDDLLNIITSEYLRVIDFYDLDRIYGIPFNKVFRVALIDNLSFKREPEFDKYFEIKEVYNIGDKRVRTLYTTIVAYDKVVAVGVNNTIRNHILREGEVVEEDVKRLFIASSKYWSIINDQKNDADSKYGAKDSTTDNLNTLYNCLFLMRYYAENPEQKVIHAGEFDSNLSTRESIRFLQAEHKRQLLNATRQLLGRIERIVPYANFESEIIIPYDDLIDQTRTNINLYDFDDDSFAYATINELDYDFMSYNNRVVFEKGVELIQGRTLTDTAREQLHDDTYKAHKMIMSLTGFNGLISKVLQTARSGDNPGVDKQLADAAIKFDMAYRSASILSCPCNWVAGIIEADHLPDGRRLSVTLGYNNLEQMLDSVFVDKSKYAVIGKNGTADLYPRQVGDEVVGLTDFVGQDTGEVEPYEPHKYVLSPLKAPVKFSESDAKSGLDARILRLIDFSSSVIEGKSSFICPGGGEPGFCSSFKNEHEKPKLASGVELSVLHPSMLHMALGNIGECLFSKFLNIYQGTYTQVEDSEICDRIGYRFYEMFDFWMRPSTESKRASWVCIDVKNFSKRENIQQTKSLLDSQGRKMSKLSSLLEGNASASDVEDSIKGMDMLFEKSDSVDFVFINIRSSKSSELRDTSRQYEVSAAGKKVVVNIHHISLFINILFLEENQRRFDKRVTYGGNRVERPKRRWVTTINPKVMRLLEIKKDTFVGDVLVEKDDDGDHTTTKVSFWDAFLQGEYDQDEAIGINTQLDEISGEGEGYEL